MTSKPDSHIILRVSLDPKRPERVAVFKWHREDGKDGRGYFVGQNKWAGGVGMIACIDLQKVLIDLARARGMSEEFNFSMANPKPKKPIRKAKVRAKAKTKGKGTILRKRKTSDGKKIPMFNPFA